MEDNVVGQQGLPARFRPSSSCCVAANQPTVYESNTCSKCARECSVSCDCLDMKPDLSTEAVNSNGTTERRSSSDNTKQNERASRENISPNESFHTVIPPVSYSQVAKETPQHVQNGMHMLLLQNDRTVAHNDGHQIILHDMSDFSANAKYIKPISKQKREPDLRNTNRFRGKRNKRGLCSKKDVSVEIDNRCKYIVTTEENEVKTFTKDMAASNVFTGAMFGKPKKPNDNLRFSKINKEHQVFQKAKNKNKRNDKIEQSFKNTYQSDQVMAAKRKQLQSSVNHSEHGEPETHQHNFHSIGNTRQSKLENDIVKPEINLPYKLNHSDQKNYNLIPETLPQNSQFHNKTITYPTTRGYRYTHKGQVPNFKQNYQQNNMSYNAEDPSAKPLPSLDSLHNVDHPQEMERGACYYDPLGEESFEDLNKYDDVPAYDKIPYALIITGTVDEKTLLRAKQKQKQQQAFDLVKLKQDSFLSKKGEEPTYIYGDNFTSDIKLAAESSAKQTTYHKDEKGNAAADGSFHQRNPETMQVANTFYRNEDLRPAVGKRISNKTDKKKIYDAVKVSGTKSPQLLVQAIGKKNRTAPFKNEADVGLISNEKALKCQADVGFINNKDEKLGKAEGPNMHGDNAPQEKDESLQACDLNVLSETITNSETSKTGNEAKPLKTGLSKKTSEHTRTQSNIIKMKDTPKAFSACDQRDAKTMFDKEVVPIAMTLIKGDNQEKPVKHLGYQRSNKSSEYAGDSGEDQIEPIAMRLLRQSKEAKKSEDKRKKLQTAVMKDGSSNSYDKPAPLLNDMRDTFGSRCDNSPFKTQQGIPKISDGGADITHPKQVNKNKNKNLCPISKTEQECLDGVTERFEDKDREEKQLDNNVDTYTDNNDSKIATSSILKDIQNYEVMLKIADKRHYAFKRLKRSQSEDNLKCTSCGRPECQGENIRRMKEMIRMARQAGLEVRDVIPDGNCMFAAVVDQLQLHGDYRFTPKSLREAVVTWLIEHPVSDDGTHYSSFLTEDWEGYLQRMIVEGEWGDHLSLRAIVEIVGYAINVINVSGEEARDTNIEPTSTDTSKDKMHLVLGHLGEFHYTSLRPAEKKDISFVPAPLSTTVEDPSLTFDDDQLTLEGTETVEMFREDYVDTWSDIPSAHFSFLLKNVIPIQVVNKAAILQSQHMDSLAFLRNPDLFPLLNTATGAPIEKDVESGGCVAEGVYVPNLNGAIGEDAYVHDKAVFEIYLIVKKTIVVGHKSGDSSHAGRQEYVIDTTGVHIGYTKLLMLHQIDSRHRYLRRVKFNSCQPDENLCLKEYYALRCLVWPECAQSWVSRIRSEGWPSKDCISSIESEGCLLLPNAHKESKCPDFEWQFSFTLCERKLYREALSLYQKYCYIVFDALCKQTMYHLKSICSSHFKSVFFYACERIPGEFWETSAGSCVFYLLNELLRYVKAKNLPNYFVHANNMFAHLMEKDFKELEEQVILLRSQPMLFLRRINENLAMLPQENTVIDKISDDITKFKEHKSLKKSTLEVFIPATIDSAQYYIRIRSFGEGYELLSQAFQQRLFVSTCDDTVPFQLFLTGAVSGLDLNSLVWFSAYTDRQLEGQLSKSLVRETCGDLPLVKIKDILPADIVGSYGNTEVKAAFSVRICTFCHDFAKFLFQTSKISEILPILYHCHELFIKKLEHANSRQSTNGQNNEELSNENFTDEAMFDIYTAMFTVYKQQQQLDLFRPVMPTVVSIVKRIRTRGAYSCLCYMYKNLGDTVKLGWSADIYSQLPKDPHETKRVSAFLYWPYKDKATCMYLQLRH